MRARVKGSRVAALLALGLVSAPATAGAFERYGLSAGWELPLAEGFGPRPTLALHGDSSAWGPVRLRGVLRGSGPAELRRSQLPGAEASLGRVVDVAPAAMLLVGFDGERLRGRLGAGMAYHLRFVSTADAAVGLPAGFEAGPIEALDLADHPGVESVAELSVRVTDALELGLSVGAAYAMTKLYARPEGDGEPFVGRTTYLSAARAELQLRFVP